jgi:hypothetical protein
MTVQLIVALPAAETARLERHGDLVLALTDCRHRQAVGSRSRRRGRAHGGARRPGVGVGGI